MTGAHRIILTRQKDRNQAWASRLETAGYVVVEVPLIRYETLPVDNELDASAFDWILFTSPQGGCEGLHRGRICSRRRTHGRPWRRYRGRACQSRPAG